MRACVHGHWPIVVTRRLHIGTPLALAAMASPGCLKLEAGARRGTYVEEVAHLIETRCSSVLSHVSLSDPTLSHSSTGLPALL